MKIRHTYVLCVQQRSRRPGTEMKSITDPIKWTLLITVSSVAEKRQENTCHQAHTYSCKPFKSAYIPIQGLRKP